MIQWYNYSITFSNFKKYTMKKITLNLLFVALIALFIASCDKDEAVTETPEIPEEPLTEKVERQYVLLEIATGTWCVNCPGAAMGADDLHKNGKKIAVLENHNGDDYVNDAGTVRIQIYGITGLPTAMFDGTIESPGGNTTESIYSSYLPKYEEALAADADFRINTKAVKTNAGAYDLTIKVKRAGNDSIGTPYLFVAYTESHIAEEWVFQTELNFVNRGFYPDFMGTQVDNETTEEQVFNITVTPDSSWKQENSEIIIFVQNMETYKVLQTDLIELSELESQ